MASFYDDLLDHHKSIARKFTQAPTGSLDEVTDTPGVGVYAVYYHGSYDTYTDLVELNEGLDVNIPVYIGSAAPEGIRTGKIDFDSARESLKLTERVDGHGSDLRDVENLDLSEFTFRLLATHPLDTKLAKDSMIALLRPVWNQSLVSGFGNNVAGKNRTDQTISLWDLIHPGRPGCGKNERDDDPEDVKRVVQGYCTKTRSWWQEVSAWVA